MKKMCIYIHIPYCKKKCYYCSFYSSDTINNFENYFNALKKEIEYKKNILNDYTIKSIYFGGGTPSYVPSKFIKNIVLCIKNNFNIDKNIEITLEANPDSLTKQKLNDYISCGVNRFSIGLQSFNNKILKAIGRVHLKEDFLKSINLFKTAGIKNISADIMLGLPYQSLQDVKDTVKNLIDLDISHISAYGLKVEKGTALFNMVKNKEIILPCEDLCADMYDYVYNKLKQNNIHRYEVSNFAKCGFECEHNINYWQGGQYLGFGTAAHSYFDNKRYFNMSNIDKYVNKINTNNQAIEKSENISKTEAEFEYIILRLRLSKGINLKEFHKLFNCDFKAKYNNILIKYKDFFIQKNEYICINDKGFFVLNIILSEFVP